MIIDLWSSWNFATIGGIKWKCDLIVNFSKFITIKMILNSVIVIKATR